ncbi:RNA polymerase subunit sigma [Clostridium botulinum]|uniref:RNA polymerase subunit sigma n=1 Tax=Clostridium botulinum TaxID=1491 RepID=UPI0019675A39|nr:RNA polymerase subunit sigma [Clostridium botulinum]MBN1079226.1 RNA polymerase subunit sigma [Clostridium botulinum]
MEEKVKRELALYKLREIEIDDMKLKIEELKVGEQIGASNFDEKVQSSMNCKNNDYVLNEIESLENRIRFYEIANKRVDNALRRLETEEEKEIIKKVFIDNKSISRTAQEMFRSRKSIKKTIENSSKHIKLA